MKKRVLAILLCVSVALGAFSGCGAKVEGKPETAEPLSAEMQERMEELSGETEPTFMGFLDYAEETGDTIKMTVLMSGYEGAISKELTTDQISLAGDISDASDVTVTSSEEEGVEAELSFTLPKGELSAENLELEATVTLAAGAMTDADGKVIDENISADMLLVMKNEYKDSGKGSILICDDASFMRMMIKNTLAKEGYSVVGEVETAQEMLNKCSELKPDIVLVDTTLNGISDLSSTVKKIRETYSGARVIVLTAMGQQDLVVTAIQAGAKDFVCKPINAEDLKESVARTIQYKP